MSGSQLLLMLMMFCPMMLRLLRFGLLLWRPIVKDRGSLFHLGGRLGSHERHIVKGDGPIIDLGSFDWVRSRLSLSILALATSAATFLVLVFVFGIARLRFRMNRFFLNQFRRRWGHRRAC